MNFFVKFASLKRATVKKIKWRLRERMCQVKDKMSVYNDLFQSIQFHANKLHRPEIRADYASQLLRSFLRALDL